MNKAPRSWYILAAVLFVAMAFAQRAVQPTFERLRAAEEAKAGKNRGALMVQLPAQFLVATATGFKEVVAAALWVRADEFFHTGQYRAIMPIVRMVTWLDPHNVDVYTTGAWHLAYNFVDSEERSDKRYIPPAIALLMEGIRNNPDSYDLYFELGWTHFNKKIEDYEAALEWMKKACKYDAYDPNTGARIPRPEFVDRMLAHQYEKLGMLDEAAEQWIKSRQRVLDLIPKDKPISLLDQSALDVCDRNLGLLYLRRAFRYGDLDAYGKAVEVYRRVATQGGATPDVVRDYKAISADYARRKASRRPMIGDASKPLDAKFEVKWERVRPRIFRISGRVNLIPASEYKGLASELITHYYEENRKKKPSERQTWRDGSRVYWMLADADYKMTSLEEFDWKIDESQTIAWDSVYIGGGSFSQIIDFSKDPEFYPFAKKKYKLIIWIKPQQSGVPDYVQDRIGWKGEALTDRKYLVTTPQPDIRMTTPGFKLLKKEIILDRSDIM